MSQKPENQKKFSLDSRKRKKELEERIIDYIFKVLRAAKKQGAPIKKAHRIFRKNCNRSAGNIIVIDCYNFTRYQTKIALSGGRSNSQTPSVQMSLKLSQQEVIDRLAEMVPIPPLQGFKFSKTKIY